MAAATSTQTVQNYCNLLTKSRLLMPDEVKDSYRRWQESLNGAEGDSEAFRKYLVGRKLLTDHQSQLLMRGHTEGFFLDQYRIMEVISKGNLAGVYKAMHPSGQIVAIKVLPPSKAKDATVLSRFQREGKLLTKLDHPNIVRAFQIGESGGKHYFVMEYFESEPLDEVINRRKRLPAGEACRIVYQTLLGLQHVFEKGMIHRDLRPANIALTPPPEEGPAETTLASSVKIFDLGLGRTTFDESAADDPETQLTTAGTLLGTPDYMAPEQARNAHSADIRADIYSAGCILYHLLTGQVPFPDSSPLSQIVKHATEPPRPLNLFVPVPDALQQAVSWMLEKDPNKRYPTPERAAQALQAFMMEAPEKKTSVAAAPLPAYMQYLQAGGHIEASKVPPPAPPKPVVEPMPKPVVEPLKPAVEPLQPAVEPFQGDISKIPVGRLETEPRKKREPSASKPKPPASHSPAMPAAPIPAPIVVPPPRPEVAPLPTTEEYDVEIVPPPQAIVSPPRTASSADRSFFDFDRRDWMMLGVGGGIIGAALALGFGVARLVRPSTTTSTPSEPGDQKKDEPKKEDGKKDEPKG